MMDPRLMNTAPKVVRLAERERLSNMTDEQDVYPLGVGTKSRTVLMPRGSKLELGDVNALELVVPWG